MAKDPELGDILMEAFVARRLLMIQLGEGNVILFGTKSSARSRAQRISHSKWQVPRPAQNGLKTPLSWTRRGLSSPAEPRRIWEPPMAVKSSSTAA
jgi:hypothetical protein